VSVEDRYAYSPELYRKTALEHGLSIQHADEVYAAAKEIDKIPDVPVRIEARKALIVRMNMDILDAKGSFRE